MPHSHMGWSIHLEVPNTSFMDKNLTSSGYLSFEFDDMNMLTMPRNAMPNLVPTMAYINALMTCEYGKFHRCSFPDEILAQSHVGCIGWQWSIERLCSPSLMGPLEHYSCCITLIEMWWNPPDSSRLEWFVYKMICFSPTRSFVLICPQYFHTHQINLGSFHCHDSRPLFDWLHVMWSRSSRFSSRPNHVQIWVIALFRVRELCIRPIHSQKWENPRSIIAMGHDHVS